MALPASTTRGGGFLTKCKENTFHTEFEPVVAPLAFRKFRFSGEWNDEQFVGYSDGARWNGWASPYATRATVEEIIKSQEILNEGLPPKDVYRFRWDDSVLMVFDPQEETEYPVHPVTLSTEDGELALYPVSFGWCWEHDSWLADEPAAT